MFAALKEAVANDWQALIMIADEIRQVPVSFEHQTQEEQRINALSTFTRGQNVQEVSMRILSAVALALVCAGTLATDAQAQRRGGGGNWVDLGCQQVSFVGKDRDSIRVGRREGRFKAIRLEARNNDVEVLDLKVVYANGAPDDIQVRSHIRAGSRTRPLDLRGRDRAIRRIDIVYRSRPNFRGLARVCAEGLD